MKTLIKKFTIKFLTNILGIINLFSLIFMFLALTDIYHNYEPDLTMEWSIVRFGFFISLLFTLFYFISTIYQVIKSLKLK
jgi:hypothetical protein